jgi:NhaP-type Na+/H+ or K+/H+ antiporter/mannitol/fructose-specific phosphotransferase system IIA component (Ntr-type)
MDILYTRLSTIVFAIFFGVALSVVARRLRFPAIAPLLLGGILLGPEVSGLVDSASLGQGLRIIIAISIATILFEGGLTLNPMDFKKVGRVVTRLLSIGVLVTWIGSAAAVYFIFDYSIPFSILAGSLVIVTGPTVIGPLLQRIKVKKNLHKILHWEGVLIDPIGVFIAILCFEWLSIDGHFLNHLAQFSLRLLIGLGLGTIGGLVIYILLKRRWVPEDQVNIFVLASALFLFAISDALAHEAGILTVVIAGLILGWKKPADLKNIKQFKSELTEMAIGVLFILLAANLKLESFLSLGWKGIILVAVVLFLIRPAGILFSASGSSLNWRERGFLSWLSPRGVVAGSMASLFTLELTLGGNKDAAFLEAFTFSVIGASILIQGFLSSKVARVLKVKAPPKKGWLIVGCHSFAQRIARFIQKHNGDLCVLIDLNQDAVKDARENGFTAYLGNATTTDSIPEEVANRIGNILALTDNRDLNQLVCEKWSDLVKPKYLFRWSPAHSETEKPHKRSGIPIWTHLEKPSQVAYDLHSKEVLLSLTKPKTISKEMFPLISFNGEKFSLKHFEKDIKGDVLFYKQLAHHLSAAIDPAHIFIDIDVPNMENLLQTVLPRALEGHPLLNTEIVLNHFKESAANPYFVLGNNVAVPHAFFKDLKKEICIIVRTNKPLILHPEEPEPVRLLFILLNPVENPGIHLTLLADIAKLASDESLVSDLFDAQNPAEILTLILEQGLKS